MRPNVQQLGSLARCGAQRFGIRVRVLCPQRWLSNTMRPNFRANVILGINVGATVAEVRSAFQKKALETHPDTNPDAADAHQRFQRVKWAYDTLMGNGNATLAKELSPLEAHKQSIKIILKEQDTTVDVVAVWRAIRQDCAADIIAIDADLVIPTA